MEHATGTLTVLLHGFALRTSMFPSDDVILLSISSFCAWYAVLLLFNYAATRHWPYLILTEAHQRAGLFGVALVAAVAFGVFLGGGFCGRAAIQG